MRFVKGMAYVCLFSIFKAISSDFDLEDKGYENQILAIEEFDNSSSTKIVISFEHSNPICAYSPENFQESIDDTVYRAFMPKTTVASNVACSARGNDDDELDEFATNSFDCDNSDAGVELLLQGESIEKFLGQHSVVFIVKK